jgi:ABC-type multidrug transport system fused ATPase/permease subunit
MTILRTIATAVAGSVIGAALLWLFQGNSLRLVPEEMSYADLSAVMLSAVSVLVTILGVIVAIVAIWGYSHFKGIAETSAKSQVSNEIENGALKHHLENSVTSFMQREFGDAGKLRALLEERVDQIIIAGPGQRAKEEAEKEGEVDVEL